MLENNIFRILMVMGSVILVGLGINLTIEHFPEIRETIEVYFNNRLPKL